jgi:ABC-type multidrug transport system fused ATPase/permease subunit
LIDGDDIKSMSKENLRKSINVVLQNPYINENDTIKRNLLGSSESTKTDLELCDVLRLCCLEGINLEDEASILSGG